MFFHQSLCDSKSPQVSWTLLSILADLNNALVIITIIIIIIIIMGEFFTWALADGFSLESEWHQVFLRLQDST